MSEYAVYVLRGSSWLFSYSLGRHASRRKAKDSMLGTLLPIEKIVKASVGRADRRI